ncbi:hypothetical protein MMC16_007653 [Acarospora aff. strigata]|nr:hypothetical protein [Acarospora aff. strigata]
MPALPLYHLARKACIKNIKSITDVGDIPYELIRPVLIKLENPHQLRDLEKASPQLCGADAEIWREFIKRDIPNWETKPHQPKNPKNWYKVYTKLRAENQAEVDKDADILKAAMDGIKTERAKHTSRVVDARTVPKLPRMGGMRAEGGRSRQSTGGTASSALTFGSGSRTRPVTGKAVLEKARREAREMSLFSARKTLLATPTHKLNDKATQVRNAPQGLLAQHKKPVAPAYTNHTPKAPPIVAPRKSSSSTAAAASTTAVERERRLKAFTTGTKRDNTGGPIPPPPSSSSSKPSSATATATATATTTTLRPQNTSTFTAPPTTTTTPTTTKPTAHNQAYPSTAYKAPRLKPSSSSSTSLTAERRSVTPSENKNKSTSTSMKSATVDPFMRVKRRRIS